MKPPICCICSRRLDENEGGLVYFKKREQDHAWDKKMEDNDMIGHPPYARWFCGEHYGKASEYRDHSVDEAMNMLEEQGGS